VSHDPSEELVTRTRSYAQLPISAFFGNDNRVPGTLPARRKSGTEAIKSFLDGTKSQDSFDPNQEYQEDVTYGQKQHENILGEIEQEDAHGTVFYDVEGHIVPSFLHEKMTMEEDDEAKAAREEGLETEHTVRAQELQKKQKAIDAEIAILKSECTIRMEHTK
jgi:hypothetical protein